MSERICHVHLGTGKTGSTAIQYALVKMLPELLRHGIDYPDLSKNMALAASGAPTAGNGAILFRELREGAVARAMRVIRQNSHRSAHIIISCEGLWQIPAETLQQFAAGLEKAGFQPRALVCFRPQIDFLVSSYCQQVKSNRTEWSVDLRQYLGRIVTAGELDNQFNWLKVADKVALAFGRENSLVWWYPALARKGMKTLVDAFFGWLGSSCPEAGLFGTVANVSPNREALLVLRWLNSAGIGNRKLAEEFLSRAHQAQLLAGRVRADRELSAKITELTAVANREMLEKYRVNCDHEDLSAEVGAMGEEAPFDRSILARMLSIAGRLIEESAEAVDVNAES